MTCRLLYIIEVLVGSTDLWRAKVFPGEAFVEEGIEIYAQIEPSVAMDNTVWYSRMHLAADDVANLVTKDQSAFGLQLSKGISLRCSCRAVISQQ